MRGSVVQKPKGTGRWYVVLDLDRDGTGRRRQKWHSGFRTKREAEKGLTALLAAQDTGTNVAPQKITLGEYLADRWLPAIEATVRPTTFAGYRAHVRVYVNPALGSIPLQSVTADQLSIFTSSCTEPVAARGPLWRQLPSDALMPRCTGRSGMP
jgi:hypothetical protein